MRMFAAVLCLVLLSCKPNPPPPASVPAPSSAAVVKPPGALPPTVPGELSVALPGEGTKQADGSTVFRSQLIFLGDNLSKAPGPVFLHLDGVSAAPGTDASLYLASTDARGYDPADYIGSVGTVDHPLEAAHIQHEVNDFDADGKSYHARTSLRGNPHFGVVLVVKTGDVKVQRFVLSTRAQSAR